MFCSSTTVQKEHSHISTATLNGFILLTDTCRSTTTQRNELLHFHGKNGYANEPLDHMYIAYVAYTVFSRCSERMPNTFTK